VFCVFLFNFVLFILAKTSVGKIISKVIYFVASGR